MDAQFNSNVIIFFFTFDIFWTRKHLTSTPNKSAIDFRSVCSVCVLVKCSMIQWIVCTFGTVIKKNKYEKKTIEDWFMPLNNPYSEWMEFISPLKEKKKNGWNHFLFHRRPNGFFVTVIFRPSTKTTMKEHEVNRDWLLRIEIP